MWRRHSCVKVYCNAVFLFSFLCLTLTAQTADISEAIFAIHYKGAPYRDSRYVVGIQAIPGRVECAYYDYGGEGVAYHDTESKNFGSGGLNPADGTYLNEFRMDEGVDTSYTKFHDQIDNSPYNLVRPSENQLYVGWTEPGEWFNITVQVAQASAYTADLLYTSNRGGTIAVDVDGRPATAPISIISHLQCCRCCRLEAMAPLEQAKESSDAEAA